MPLYNAATFLNESLQSIAVQTYPYWQLVVVDDGSTDDSVNIYNSFAAQWPNKCTLLQSPKKQSGAGVCRNIGIKNCKGDLIIFFDADDVLAPFCLAQRVIALAHNDMAIFQQYYWQLGQSTNHAIFNGKATNRMEAIQAFIKMEAPWQTMAPIWRTTALQKLLGFDETLVYMEDPDLHLRALLNNEIKIAFEYNLPADNYYRINNMNAEKAALFYDNSIKSRMVFLKKLILNAAVVDKFKNEIRSGFFIFLKNFVLARFIFYKDDVVQISNRLHQIKVLSTVDKLLLNLVFKIFTSNSFVVKALRLKGIVYKII